MERIHLDTEIGNVESPPFYHDVHHCLVYYGKKLLKWGDETITIPQKDFFHPVFHQYLFDIDHVENVSIVTCFPVQGILYMHFAVWYPQMWLPDVIFVEGIKDSGEIKLEIILTLPRM
jgi:hypothetical protein